MKIATSLTLPDDVVTQTFLCVGRRGSGKTHTASVLAEGMLEAGWPIIVIDPVGVWWGLRSKYEVVILGGDHGDLPLDPAGGKAIADFLISEKMPTILDVSEFTESDMVRIVGDVASRFYTATDRHPVHWFIDEADEFAPQGGQATGGNIPKCMGAVQRLVRRGRAKGIGMTLITQRCAVINKSVSTQTECLLAHQTTGPQDIDAIDGWIKHQGTKEERNVILSALPKLSPGECFAYSPAWLGELRKVKIKKRRSFDSSSTPKPGEKRKEPKRLAEVDLAGLSQSMAATVEQAKANDPKELKRQIAELKKQIKTGNTEDIEKLTQDFSQHLQKAKADKNELRERLVAVRDLADIPMTRQVTPQTASSESTKPFIIKVETEESTNGDVRLRNSKANPKTPFLAVPPSSDLSDGEFRVLRSLYWLQNEDRTPVKVAFFAKYTVNGHFNNLLGKLRKKELVEGWMITTDGINQIPSSIEPKPTGEELQQWIRPMLQNPHQKVLDALLAVYGERIAIPELAAAAGYTVNGHFNNVLGKLRKLQIAEGTAREGVRANPVFFE